MPCLALWEGRGEGRHPTLCPETCRVTVSASSPRLTQPLLSLSYRFGRKLTLTSSYLLLVASGSCAAFSPNLHVDMIFSFLSGCSTQAWP